MAGSDHTVRGKLVRLRAITASVAESGSLNLDILGAYDSTLHISEADAIDLYHVLGDVIEYGPGDGSGTTDGATWRDTDRLEAAEAGEASRGT